jgi:hypothetical protein
MFDVGCWMLDVGCWKLCLVLVETVRRIGSGVAGRSLRHISVPV